MSDDCWGAGAEAATTNNRMELLSVAMLLEAVPTATPVHIQADSTYVIDALTKWRHGWKRRGWKTASGDPVKNRDLIEHLDALMEAHTPTFEWVRGHTGHAANEAADERSACRGRSSASRTAVALRSRHRAVSLTPPVALCSSPRRGRLGALRGGFT